jgi:hypothetical protein
MAPTEEQEDKAIYVVVVNHEEQYSVGPKRKSIPTTVVRVPRSPSPATRSIPICCVAWRSRVRIRSGRWTSLTSRGRAASCISLSSSTGQPTGCLSWRLSITMEAAFCVETLEDALARHGRPEMFNTDQGSQFTGSASTGVLAINAIAISMDGKGAWRDNVFIERLWRSVKYEEVYLRAYKTVGEARNSIGRYLEFYNGRRPHSSRKHPGSSLLQLAATPLGSLTRQRLHLSTRRFCSDNRDQLSSSVARGVYVSTITRARSLGFYRAGLGCDR